MTRLKTGVAVTTVGRPALHDLLSCLAASTETPAAVCIADQSRGGLDVDPGAWPFPVTVVPSRGGASRGRNNAVANLNQPVDVLWFPNDDSRLGPGVLEAARKAFEEPPRPAALTGALLDPQGARFSLPEQGAELDRVTVWRAIEPTTFVRSDAFAAVGGFREDLGTGCPTPWQSGEGTDLLLRVMASGGLAVSRPDIVVEGPGERRTLDDRRLVAKHRGYARGTGYVYRLHRYPLRRKVTTLVGPFRHPLSHAPRAGLSLRLAVARSIGRLEGLLGRTLGDQPPGRQWG